MLRGARAITMKGNEIIENADVVVTNNRITAIGKRGSVAIPNGAHVVDVSGKTIMPGFVDTHAHLRVASDIHRDVQWSYAVNLAYGVTTARDPQTGQTDVLSYEDEVRSGNVLGPRIYSTGPGVFSYTGVRDLESARRILRRYSDYYDTKTIKEYETGNREVRQWVIQAANELHLMPTTEGGLDYPMNITEAFDGYSGHEHTIPTYPLQNDVIKLLVESGITYTPTLIVSYGGPWIGELLVRALRRVQRSEAASLHAVERSRREDLPPRRNEQSGAERRARRAGSRTISTRRTSPAPTSRISSPRAAAPASDHTASSRGSATTGRCGRSRWAACSESRRAARRDDHRRRRARPREGRRLDRGGEGGRHGGARQESTREHSQHVKSIQYVMKNGRLYEANTLDEVWPRQKKAGSYYWQVDEGGTSTKTP